jgi:hypothetical protein
VGETIFVRDRQGKTIGTKRTDKSTGITTVRDRHGNVVGYGDATREQTRGKDGNLLRWDSDPSFLLK